MVFRNTKQLLADYAQTPVRDISMSKLAAKYASIADARRAQDIENEFAEAPVNVHKFQHLKAKFEVAIEAAGREENAHLPVTSVFEALQIVKTSKDVDRDVGLRALRAHLESAWKKNRTANITVSSFETLRDHYRRNYPKSAVGDMLDKIAANGYLALEVSKLASIASEINSQDDYEDAILRHGLQANNPACKKARQFILALVNGDEDITENEHYNRHFRPYEKPDRDAPPYAEDEDVSGTQPEVLKLWKELREKKQQGDKIGKKRTFERTAQEGNIIFHGQYVNVSLDTSDPEAPLIFSGNVEELAEDQPRSFADAIDDFMGNGGDYLNPEDIGALTDAPIIGYDGKAYGFMDYAVKDELEELMNGNKVVFQYGGEYEYPDDEKFAKKAQEDEEEFDSEWGKYDSPLAKKLWEASLESEQDDEASLGDTWYALFKPEKAVLWQDSQGFIHAQQFSSLDELEMGWEDLLNDPDFAEDDEDVV